MREKFKRGGIKIMTVLVAMTSLNTFFVSSTNAESCPALKIIFARGSGGERWKDQNYLEFKKTIEQKLATVNLDYEFVDLDYPAVGVGVDNLSVTLGAFFGAGEAYEFGESVNTGVKNLKAIVNSTACPHTKYVIGGYSQGAMVISKALASLKVERIIYAATFGDPKIYLPEGEGVIPAACRGENLSDYRMYVPDCQAYKGLLGSYIPYEPEAYAGKVGTWCNKRDLFCSSHFNVTDHLNYTSDNLYEDASRVIFDKIAKHFGLENHVTSPHDTAFLIDSTGSMDSMINAYKQEALRLAKETLASGGRVALYDYRDLNDPYEAVEHCNFETCSLEIFESELSKIRAFGGGDELESLLSSSVYTMTKLNWKYGATKSLVVLTDAGYLTPDRDGITLEAAVELSKKIDPVNFYIITVPESANYYNELATLTDGKVVTNFDELSLLTDYIIERYDSLPRVEETEAIIEQPNLEISKSELMSETEIKINFETNAEKTLMILNDKILGTTTEKEIVISEINVEDCRIVLVPILKDRRGESAEVKLRSEKSSEETVANHDIILIPKAPNTGRR